jgi:acyl-CoA synthetase (AMP-forming)/AMP-acid ligase II
VVHEDDPFSFAFTSGTTGVSKAALISHRNSVVGSISHAFAMSLRPHHTLLILSPMFVFGSCANRFNAIVAGARMVLSETDGQSILNAIESERVTHMVINPTVLQRLVAHPSCKLKDVSSIEFIAGSGAPTPHPVVQDVISRFGDVWHVWYGATETVAGVFLLKEDWMWEGRTSPRLRSIGRGSPFIEVKVVSETGQPVARDMSAIGEIICRGDSVCSGYYRDKEGTEQAFRDGWYHTGDLGVVDEDGYIYLVDRKKDLIISGAMNIYPKEIEDLLHSHASVEACSVVGVPHPSWGETPKAFVRLRPGHSASEQELIAFCGSNLAHYKRPSSVEFVESFPTNSMGKIVKRELRRRHLEHNPAKGIFDE